ncbi:hypothetical protein DSM3645_03483 [Blastopirellula marina DSM 3645]|uniref:Uncharacterized protein n=1 Tax=Blastopirellula marina DSM 3645 TaxID=314230 RepID=A3ZW10_9BACT|nr:hypothetical protein DSM3645_03483 [Blastopirellula marina DSM 3645]
MFEDLDVFAKGLIRQVNRDDHEQAADDGAQHEQELGDFGRCGRLRNCDRLREEHRVAKVDKVERRDDQCGRKDRDCFHMLRLDRDRHDPFDRGFGVIASKELDHLSRR